MEEGEGGYIRLYIRITSRMLNIFGEREQSNWDRAQCYIIYIASPYSKIIGVTPSISIPYKVYRSFQ